MSNVLCLLLLSAHLAIYYHFHIAYFLADLFIPILFCFLVKIQYSVICNWAIMHINICANKDDVI